MLRSILAVLAMTATLATPALAFDIDQMSDNERSIFRSEIRDYLLENPEVLMEAIQVLEERRAREATAQEDQLLADNHDAIFNDGYSYVGGNPDGDVTIVEFMDYRCGFCKRAFPAVEELIASDGNIRFILKEFPILGPASDLASRYAIATKLTAGDEAYKEVHNKLMTWAGDITEGTLGRIANGVDMDHEAALARMNDDEVSEMIRQNRELAAKLQIQGTPSFVMNETFVRGYVELDQMRELVRLIREEQS